MKKIKDENKIFKVIYHLISNSIDVKALLNNDKTKFTTKLIKINKINPYSSINTKASIIIEKLHPQNGNELIQLASTVTLEFQIKGKSCNCAVNYQGISSTPPHFGFFLSIPQTIGFEEKREEERIEYEYPYFVSAEFMLGEKDRGKKLYELEVINGSNHGLGLIITKKDFDLLKKLREGDKIREISFFAPWSMVKVNGIIKHITKIEHGRYKGGYQIGIESKELAYSRRS